MEFIEAIIKINKRKDLELCPDKTELNGIHSSICVYKDGQEFLGKLRWPKDGKPAKVDFQVEEELG